VFKQAWHKVIAMKNHPPGLDVLDVAAAVISLAIFVWVLSRIAA
jgi:hypothetical protein